MASRYDKIFNFGRWFLSAVTLSVSIYLVVFISLFNALITDFLFQSSSLNDLKMNVSLLVITLEKVVSGKPDHY